MTALRSYGPAASVKCVCLLPSDRRRPRGPDQGGHEPVPLHVLRRRGDLVTLAICRVAAGGHLMPELTTEPALDRLPGPVASLLANFRRASNRGANKGRAETTPVTGCKRERIDYMLVQEVTMVKKM